MKRFFALSRTTHGIIDIANPAFVALLWLGDFPHWKIILLALFTAFAAYTAIYALNDLVGIAVDREKFTGGINAGYSVEASALRYPIAQNELDYRSGVLWFAGWYIAALVGAYLLNPVIVMILILAAILEVTYCLLYNVTYWRTLVSGLVKACGPISAIFVVDRNPEPQFVLLILAWVMFWEIGGQNIPADWNDVVEDRRVHAKTIPLSFGAQKAGLFVMIALTLAVITSLFLPAVSPAALGWPYRLVGGLAGVWMLLVPAVQLYRNRQDGRQAAKLFDRASYYPLVQFLVVAAFIVIGWM